MNTRIVSALLATLMTCCGSPAIAHETDQYSLPIGRDFADLSVFFSQLVYEDIVAATAQANQEIEASLHNGRPSDTTAHLQSADYIAGKVWAYMFGTFPTNEGLDTKLHSEAFRANYPGVLTAYRAESGIYDHPGLLIDITKFVRVFFRASTVNINGTLTGTDKLIHFLHLGRIYHSHYTNALEQGIDPETARAGAVRISAGGNLFLSENALLGMVTTGIRSNADLAADYAGFKFFLNLTEEIQLGDRTVAPMLLRDGHYWRLNDQVTPYSDYFVQFVSPHWNEALNYNNYAVYTDNLVRTMLRRRCPDLVDWYRDSRGNRRSPQQFMALSKQLSTYYGEDYGWQDGGDGAISIASVCFQAEEETPRVSGAGAEDSNPDRFGRSEFWWAANEGELEVVQHHLAQGANPNAADIDGETPLHVAARWGHTNILAALLAHGASPSAPALYDTTPLHVSVREQRQEATRMLLEHGADPNARDTFGHSPLHEAALRNDLHSARLLLAAGADTRLAGEAGESPLKLANRAGHQAMLKLLASPPTAPGG